MKGEKCKGDYKQLNYFVVLFYSTVYVSIFRMQIVVLCNLILIFIFHLDEPVNPVEADDFDIRTEIQNYLPSNTLHRRKQTVFAPVTLKSFTLPRKGDSATLKQTLSLNRIRQLSYPTKKRSFLAEPTDVSDVATSSAVQVIYCYIGHFMMHQVFPLFMLW